MDITVDVRDSLKVRTGKGTGSSLLHLSTSRTVALFGLNRSGKPTTCSIVGRHNRKD